MRHAGTRQGHVQSSTLTPMSLLSSSAGRTRHQMMLSASSSTPAPSCRRQHLLRIRQRTGAVTVVAILSPFFLWIAFLYWFYVLESAAPSAPITSITEAGVGKFRRSVDVGRKTVPTSGGSSGNPASAPDEPIRRSLTGKEVSNGRTNLILDERLAAATRSSGGSRLMNGDATGGSSSSIPKKRSPQKWETLSQQVRQKSNRLRWRIPPPAQDGLSWNTSMPTPIVLSRNAPRVVLFPDFISPQEREHLMHLAETEHFERSRVMDGDGSNQQKIRTSSGAWLDDLQDDTVFAINQRIQHATGIPWAFGENTHVLKYQPGEKYEAHVDSCFMGDFVGRRMDDGGTGTLPDDQFTSIGCEAFLAQADGPSCGFQSAGGVTCGDRVATVLMYLKAPEEGGETAFPRASRSFQSLSHHFSQGKPIPYGMDVETTSEVVCALPSTFKVAPRAGDALLFWNYDLREGWEDSTGGDPTGSALDGSGQTDAVLDLTSLHAGCPVIRGEKWVATKWLRSSFYKPLFYMDE